MNWPAGFLWPDQLFLPLVLTLVLLIGLVTYLIYLIRRPQRG